MKTDLLDLQNCDCMNLMPRYRDNHFDLAIVDPPYGIGQTLARVKSRCKKAASQVKDHFDWDSEPPSSECFHEIIRVSKNQIIFGANHFISRIPYDSSCWIVWQKNTSGSFADCELAWTSFDTAVRRIEYTWNGFVQGRHGRKKWNVKKKHPTTKPVALYNWILRNYAKKGQTILDTHAGSFSIAMACYHAKHHLTACEIDKDYYLDAVDRIQREISQYELQTH